MYIFTFAFELDMMSILCAHMINNSVKEIKHIKFNKISFHKISRVAKVTIKANIFWYKAEMKINIFFLLMQNFIELYDYQGTVKSFRKYPKHQYVRSPPEHFAIGYVHYILPLGNITLQYVIQINCRKSYLMVFFYDFLHFLKIKKKYRKQ